jgi:hypothetical protein
MPPASTVLRMIIGTSALMRSVEPPLKPSQPKNSRKAPVVDSTGL